MDPGNHPRQLSRGCTPTLWAVEGGSLVDFTSYSAGQTLLVLNVETIKGPGLSGSSSRLPTEVLTAGSQQLYGACRQEPGAPALGTTPVFLLSSFVLSRAHFTERQW